MQMLGNLFVINFIPTIGLWYPDQIAFDDQGYTVKNAAGQRLLSFEVDNEYVDDSIGSDDTIQQILSTLDGSFNLASIITQNYVLSGSNVSIVELAARHGVVLDGSQVFKTFNASEFKIEDFSPYTSECGAGCYNESCAVLCYPVTETATL